MKAGTADLLERAADDEATLHLPDLRVFPFGQHAQATIEKLLKALTNELGRKYSTTHDLEELARELAAFGEALPTIDIKLGRLTHYAMDLRYEGTENLPPPLDRQACLEAVALIKGHVLRRIQALNASMSLKAEEP
jgi:hypothetical protein